MEFPKSKLLQEFMEKNNKQNDEFLQIQLVRHLIDELQNSINNDKVSLFYFYF